MMLPECLLLLSALFVLGSARVSESGAFAGNPASEASGKKDDRITSLNASLEPKELVEDVNGRVLELIVKIAEQPATWRKIHRVLETLEANNAAYSQRVDANRNNEESWLIKRVDRLGDKRNDVPDDSPVPTTTETNFQSVELEFQRWKEALFASEASDSNEDTLAHPQFLASSTDSTLTTETAKTIEEAAVAWTYDAPQPPEKLKFEKKFEERLNEIEDELRRLTKLSQMLPLQVNRLKQSAHFQQFKDKKTDANGHHKANSDEAKRNGSSHSKPTHPKFHYHRVETRDMKSLDRLVGSEFWNRVASLKENATVASVTKRNAIVAVSLTPVLPNVHHKVENMSTHDGLMQATEPVRPVKLCKRKCHLTWRKNKQHQRKSATHQLENVDAKVENSYSIN